MGSSEESMRRLNLMNSKDSIFDLARRTFKAISIVALILITCAGTAYFIGKVGGFIYQIFGALL